MKIQDKNYIKLFLVFTGLWILYIYGAFILNDKAPNVTNVWATLSWLIFWSIPIINNIYIKNMHKPVIQVINWILCGLYIMYLFPILNGFIGSKIIIQPAYIISIFLFIVALKNKFMHHSKNI